MAQSGIGRLVCEGTGNTYMHMSEGAGIYYQAPNNSDGGSTSESRSSQAHIPTQESHLM